MALEDNMYYSSSQYLVLHYLCPRYFGVFSHLIYIGVFQQGGKKLQHAEQGYQGNQSISANVLE